MELYPHNQQAYNALLKMLQMENRACVIEPPGCGKSFIALKLIEDNPDKDFLWLGPNSYVFAEQKANFEHAGASLPKNVTTMTYAAVMTKARGGQLRAYADYVILDEFHHCGAPEWGKGVDIILEQCPTSKIVGLSATEIRYSDNERNMAQELFFGNVAWKMSFEEAWVRGILPFPIYVCALYDSASTLGDLIARIDEIREERRRSSLKRQYEKLRRAVDLADGLDIVFEKHLTKKSSKIVVFCSGVRHVEELCLLGRTWFKRVNENIHTYKTYDANPFGEKDYTDFKKDDSDALKVLYCINQLNEGVHIKGIDAVVMVRPTQSPVIFKQQLGRALDVGGGRTPLVFDLVNNLESAGSIIPFQRSLESLYGDLAARGEAELFDPKDFVIYDELKDARFLLSELRDAVSPNVELMIQVRPRLATQWCEEDNRGLSASSVSANSAYEAMWECPECKGRWRASVRSRIKDARCPYCIGKKVLPGYNDLGAKFPQLGFEWDEKLNRISASEVMGKPSKDIAYWSCAQGHTFRDSIESRIRGSRCPFCDGFVLDETGSNSLEAMFPHIAGDWHPHANSKLEAMKITPRTIPFGHAVFVWWRCSKCGHKWEERVSARTVDGLGCPVCEGRVVIRGKNDLASADPDLCKEWFRSRNEGAAPWNVYRNSEKTYWWRCPTCLSAWKESPKSRREDRGCPFCANKRLKQGMNDFKSKYPSLATEWRRQELADPCQKRRGSGRVMFTENLLVRWRCSKCDCQWEDFMQSRIESFEKTGAVVDCPRCHGQANPGAMKQARILASSKPAERPRKPDAPLARSTDKPSIAVGEDKRWRGRNPKPSKNGHAGETVFHDKYGEGVIESIMAGKVYARFPEAGVKIFDQKTCFAKRILKRYPPIIRPSQTSESKAVCKAKAENVDGVRAVEKTCKDKRGDSATSFAVVEDALSKDVLDKLEELKRSFDSKGAN